MNTERGDANNRLTNMVDAAGTTRYAYTDFGAPLSEDGPWDSDTVSYTFTTNWMRNKITLLQPNASDWVQTYSYDGAGRLANTTSPAGAFGYLYDTAHNLMIRKLTQPHGSFITNTYDMLGRWTGTYQKHSDGTVLNAHEYLYDDASRRTRQTRTGGDRVDYTYDNIGQLKISSGKESGGSPNRMNEQLGYAYDAAGNLNYRTNDALVQTFNVNNQNEITNVTRSGKLTVSGTTWGAATNVTVADNGNSPVAALRYADSSFARTNVTLLNGTNTFTAVAQDSYGRADTNTALNYLPSTNIFAWDRNGNLTTNGTRVFAFDDENELTTITEPGAWKSEFTYDGKMRRRIRKEYIWNSALANWQCTLEVRYVYDDKVVIQERHFHPQLSTETAFNSITYTRGSDLSRGLNGAGGIGGLLARTDNSTLSAGTPSIYSHAYYHADGNGNVTMLIATNQTVAARYWFDPFGRVLASSGTLADANLYRFSSQEAHPPSDLVCFLYRSYDPRLQRWVQRDPISELGFRRLALVAVPGAGMDLNQYTYVRNGPLNLTDPHGLSCWSDCMDASHAVHNATLQNCLNALNFAGAGALGGCLAGCIGTTVGYGPCIAACITGAGLVLGGIGFCCAAAYSVQMAGASLGCWWGC